MGRSAGSRDRATTGPEDGESIGDGRLLRSVRSRERIASALFELIEEGELVPTGEQVAARAGVGLRTVFRHFEDMETLYAELQERIQRLARPILEAELSEGTLSERVAVLARQRANAFERIAPFKRAGDLQRWRSAFVRDKHASTVRELRAHLRRALPELDELTPSRQHALELLTSLEAWERLRHDQGLGKERAQDVVRDGVLALFGTET